MNRNYIRSEVDTMPRQRESSWLSAAALIAIGLLVTLGLLFLAYEATAATTVTRQGGSSDFACCEDANCDKPIAPQYARDWAAKDACAALTEADGKTRYFRQWPMRIDKTGTTTPPPQANGSATVTWTHDGANVTGFRILYGPSTALASFVDVPNPAARAYVVDKLAAGTWYFTVRALNGMAESGNSNVASKVIQ